MKHEDLSRVDLNLLVLFEAVMADRHVGRAAKRLALSASAISHGLTRLRRLLHDPLFLKHPKGVVPTERAAALAEPIAEILQRVRVVVGETARFDPSASTRRFTIGSPDVISIGFVPRLLGRLAAVAPGVDLALRNVMPQTALAELDARQADLVIQPLIALPPRFTATSLFDEEFAIAMRAGHPLGPRPTLAQYCAASHVVVSAAGDPFGNVDIALKQLGHRRRVAATAPNFVFALALVAETDLIAAVPRRQVTPYLKRFDLVLVEPPAPLPPLGASAINLIATRASLADAGVAWLYQLVAETAVPPPELTAARRAPGRRPGRG